MKFEKIKKNILKSIKPSIHLIDQYKTGNSKSEQKIIKLSSNESPFKIPLEIKKSINNILLNANLYPDGDSHLLKKSIAKRFKIKFQQIICGNGSDDILSLISSAFSRENCEIICSKYGFLFYPIVAKTSGAKVIFSNCSENYEINTQEILKEINKNTRIIFFANPNNPTGLIIEKVDLINMLKKIPSRIVVVIDGAYAEYVTDKKFSDGLDLVNQFPNLIITRTFSKIFGLAGFRIGWAYSSKFIIDIMEKIRGPFNVNQVAQKAGSMILQNRDFFEKSILHNNKWKKWTIENLNNLGLKTLLSHGNFLLVQVNIKNITAKQIVKRLEGYGIKIRYMEGYNLKNHVRISIGLGKDLKELIKYLKIILRRN